MTKKHYIEEEEVLAQRLYTEALASGTLKAAPGLFAAKIGNGPIISKSREVTWRDYLRDARKILARPRPGGPRRR
ncbi:hypothetical protein SAMN06297144_2286 [Sphingomonas guangdongensis]|uniref:Uncharacterized protein n=1 Tax=Sphingomonas guangdongensis TaxID=1141890 RepID=A0A285QZ22_9SPHN|nr:hypothetical protein [Sphingomonas guangdongensis]SOB87163.1 hypothetical protein SAMN06297144_2286 [Sphingomonas guangdongensis]